MQVAEESGQGSMPAAVGVHDLSACHGSIYDVIYFKLLGVSEMLINLSVLIGNCNSHDKNSSRYLIYRFI